MEKQIWQLKTGEGGWISAGQIYKARPESYFVRFNYILAETRGGINQVYIWRESDGFHGRYYQEWDFDRIDAILPDDVIPLKSFRSYDYKEEIKSPPTI